MSYNGWSNYETWNCNLWLDNDEGCYSMIREWAEECCKDADTRDEAEADLAERIEQLIDDEFTPELPASMASDLLRAAMGEIDYREIAEHHIADVWDEVKDDDNDEVNE